MMSLSQAQPLSMPALQASLHRWIAPRFRGRYRHAFREDGCHLDGRGGLVLGVLGVLAAAVVVFTRGRLAYHRRQAGAVGVAAQPKMR
jgi:hypothetical protein